MSTNSGKPQLRDLRHLARGLYIDQISLLIAEDLPQASGLLGHHARYAQRLQESDRMVGKTSLIAAAAATTLILTAPSSWADEEYWAAVMRELPEASVSLDQALKTSEQEGKPISAEYDVEDGDLQISVYVERIPRGSSSTLDRER